MVPKRKLATEPTDRKTSEHENEKAAYGRWH